MGANTLEMTVPPILPRSSSESLCSCHLLYAPFILLSPCFASAHPTYNVPRPCLPCLEKIGVAPLLSGPHCPGFCQSSENTLQDLNHHICADTTYYSPSSVHLLPHHPSFTFIPVFLFLSVLLFSNITVVTSSHKNIPLSPSEFLFHLTLRE